VLLFFSLGILLSIDHRSGHFGAFSRGFGEKLLATSDGLVGGFGGAVI
jgi:hypothetical protein